MKDLVIKSEPLIRIGFFVGMILCIGFWEHFRPKRSLTQSKLIRWRSNFGMVIVNTLLVRVLLPTSAVGFAILCENQGFGLFNAFGVFAHVPVWILVVLSVVGLDLTIYFQHWLFHHTPWLWKFHKVHHADRDVDLSTGVRFHFVEILLSMGIKLGVIAIVGAPALAVLIFEVLLNATSIFNHGNVRIAPSLDHLLRKVLVTPDMHRIHHSYKVHETNSNFGFNLTWWDHLFGTYRDQPEDGHTEMTLGLEK